MMVMVYYILRSYENVGRAAATSEHMVADIRRKDRRTPMKDRRNPMKVLVAKTFHFVQRIWKTYIYEKLLVEWGMSFMYACV